MKADDPRHGTSAGYVAGCRAECCRAAIAAWTRHRRTRLYLAGTESLMIDGTGTRRRIRALMANGWSSVLLDERLGRKRTFTARVVSGTSTVRRTTADMYRDLYAELRDQDPPATTRYERQRISRLTGQAALKGWPTPGQWLDIDDPDETPDPGYRTPHWRASDDYDFAVVERILARDFALAAMTSRAEKEAVCAAWIARGDSANELERLSNWNVRRYLQTGREREAS